MIEDPNADRFIAKAEDAQDNPGSTATAAAAREEGQRRLAELAENTRIRREAMDGS